MAEKKGTVIIIKKKKGGGHAGAHGGAWKVAYADFVTAMMCFFMVMWLMGGDEQTKAAIAHYFNNPNSPYQQGRDPASTETRPLGEQIADGESIMSGSDGKTPDSLVDHPEKPFSRSLAENEELSETARQLLEGDIYGMDATVEHLKFSIPAHLLFEPGSVRFSAEAEKTLGKLGKFFADYKGFITIESHTDDDPATRGKFSSDFEFTMSRSVAVMDWLVKKNFVTEDRLQPLGAGGKRMLASNETPQGKKKNRRVEFTLSSTRAF